MDIKNVLSIVGGLVMVAGFVPYIKAIFRGTAKPSKASWLIWAILDSITLAAMYTEGATNGQIIGSVACAWVVTALSLRYGIPGWSKLDKFCLASAAIGITLWQALSSPLLALGISLTVVFLGSIPTFVSAWKDPSREDKLAWALFWVSCVLSVMAVPNWTMADVAQPMTFLVIESIMMYILFLRPRK